MEWASQLCVSYLQDIIFINIVYICHSVLFPRISVICCNATSKRAKRLALALAELVIQVSLCQL